MHMREFGNPNSRIYWQLKNDQERERAFMARLVEIMLATTQFCSATTVSLADLRAFNSKYGLNLDPYALGIYCCLVQIHNAFPGQRVEIVIDSFDKSFMRSELAWKYSESDVFEGERVKRFIPIPLQEKDSWRTILPLQAADICAWEIRKFRHDRRGWSISDSVRADRELMKAHYREWDAEHKPRKRGSFMAMLVGKLFQTGTHIVLDRQNLEDLQERHPNGWGG